MIYNICEVKINKNFYKKSDLSLVQIAHFIMNIKDYNKRKNMIDFYKEKLGDNIFDIVGNNFIINSDNKYNKDYVEFIFIIFTYRIAKICEIDLKDVKFNLDLMASGLTGTIFNQKIELCPIDYEYSDFYDYTSLINTIFHEIEHAIQNKKISSKITINNLNYKYLKMIKEIIIIKNHSLYDIGNINYQLECFEVDARLKSIINTFKFIQKYNSDKAKLYLIDIMPELKFNRKINHIIKRLKLDENINFSYTDNFFYYLDNIDNDNKTTLIEMFDGISDIESYLNEYPLLLLEYNRFGIPYDDTEVANRICKCLKILNNTKYKNCDLKKIEYLKLFYSSILKDRNKVKNYRN